MNIMLNLLLYIYIVLSIILILFIIINKGKGSEISATFNNNITNLNYYNSDNLIKKFIIIISIILLILNLYISLFKKNDLNRVDKPALEIIKEQKNNLD
jgi:protein translocase SecG subunit